MSRISTSFFALAMVAAGGSSALTSGGVDPAFRGQWVPAKATCESPLKVVIEANKVTLVNGAQRAEYPKLDQCFSCAGRDVDHIIWLSTDKMGDSPWIFHFDKKKKQIVSSDFSNDKKLAARFPFGNGALKKCG